MGAGLIRPSFKGEAAKSPVFPESTCRAGGGSARQVDKAKAKVVYLFKAWPTTRLDVCRGGFCLFLEALT